jgi:hypothetical protein
VNDTWHSGDIDAAKAELLAAGWIELDATTWKAPDGSRYRGPAGAWRMMKHAHNDNKPIQRSLAGLAQDVASIAWTCVKQCADHQPPPVLCVKHQIEAAALLLGVVGTTPVNKRGRSR